MYGPGNVWKWNIRSTGRGLEFSREDKESIARQQPLFWHYCSGAQKRADSAETGADHKHIVDAKERVPGFDFVLPTNPALVPKLRARREKLEGEALDVAWLDERAPGAVSENDKVSVARPERLLIVTFTPINDGSPRFIRIRSKQRDVVRSGSALLQSSGQEKLNQESRKAGMLQGLQTVTKRGKWRDVDDESSAATHLKSSNSARRSVQFA